LKYNNFYKKCFILIIVACSACVKQGRAHMVRLTINRWRFLGIRKLWLPLLFLVWSTFQTTGCVSWQSSDGTRHTLVLGLGIVSTKASPDNTATAMRCQTIGVAVQTGQPHGGVVIGYQSLQQTDIASQWQGVIEVSSTPGQPLIVKGGNAGIQTEPAVRLTSREELQ
jgi:hypothetical protein